MAVESLILRFRDLATDPGETFLAHRHIVEEAGHVFWGWWSKRVLEMLQRIRPSIGGSDLHLYLNDLRAKYTVDNLPTFDELRLADDEARRIGLAVVRDGAGQIAQGGEVTWVAAMPGLRE